MLQEVPARERLRDVESRCLPPAWVPRLDLLVPFVELEARPPLRCSLVEVVRV